MATKEYDLKDFTKIEVGGAFEVEVAHSDTFGVSVTAADFPHIRVEKMNDTLIIKRQGIEWFAPFHNQPKAKVTLPVLTSLEVSGASRGTVADFQSDADLTVSVSGASRVDARNISAGNVDVKVTGASTLKGDIKSRDEAKFEVTGASKIDIAGTGKEAVLDINGASHAELDEFSLQDADVKVTGASHAMVNVNGKLDVNVSGASTLLWSGSPVMGDVQTSGASTLKRK